MNWQAVQAVITTVASGVVLYGIKVMLGVIRSVDRLTDSGAAFEKRLDRIEQRMFGD